LIRRSTSSFSGDQLLKASVDSSSRFVQFGATGSDISLFRLHHNQLPIPAQTDNPDMSK
jgi:hypothetical protein